MKTFYSSAFVSIILAFLMFAGYSDQVIEVAENPKTPNFRNYAAKMPSSDPESVKIEIFDDLFSYGTDDFALNTIPKIKDLELEADGIEIRLYFIPDINDEINYMSTLSLKCAADQNQYWGMYTKLHQNKNILNKKSFLQFGKELEINTEAMQDCMKDEVYKDNVEEDVKYSSEKNIIFKPAIIINEHHLIGNQPFENIHKIITQSLKDVSESKIPKPLSPADPVSEIFNETEKIETDDSNAVNDNINEDV